MDKVVVAVRRYILEEHLIQKGDSIVVAFSGGPDSLFAVHILNILKESMQFELKACHFDHQYREDSYKDATFTESVANSLSIPIVIEKNSEKAVKKGLQAAAREARYKFFDSLVKDNFGDKIVTCHTLDDSVETSILWMLRGAGPKAFGGIPPIRDVYIRPILNTEKKTILGWLKKANLTYISDPSNETDLYRRNRIRHNIIPELVKEEPTAVRSIANLTQLIKAQSDYIENVAVEKLRKVERKNGLNIDELLQVEMTIRYAIYRLFARNNGLDDRVLTNKKLADLDKLLIAKKLGSTVNLYQNFSFCLDHDGLYIEKGSNITQSISEPFKIPLELKIESLGKLTIMANYKAESKFNVDLDKINQLSSSIRQRIGGDYLINNGHRKSLKKYMIEKSIPDRIRHKLPLIVEGQQVLLIPGWFICEQIKATPMSDNICSVEFEMESDN